MRVIVCVDNAGGMMFNNRRQSRDRVLIEDVAAMTQGSRLYIDGYSTLLFADFEGRYTVDPNMLSVAEDGDFCFVENKCLKDSVGKIEEIVVYRWNRSYPSDFKLDLDLAAEGFSIAEVSEFAGYSHEKITKEVYRR